jgi:hypothetical protein
VFVVRSLVTAYAGRTAVKKPDQLSLVEQFYGVLLSARLDPHRTTLAPSLRPSIERLLCELMALFNHPTLRASSHVYPFTVAMLDRRPQLAGTLLAAACKSIADLHLLAQLCEEFFSAHHRRVGAQDPWSGVLADFLVPQLNYDRFVKVRGV